MSDREITLAAPDKQAPRCAACGRTKMQVSSESGTKWECVNCGTSDAEKTGQTLVHLNPGEEGPMKWALKGPGTLPAQDAYEAKAQALTMYAPGTVSINVPLELFPDLVIWARKLKLPKNWAEATKIKAITDFQVELTNKLGGLK